MVRGTQARVSYLFDLPRYPYHSHFAPRFLTEFEYGPTYFDGLIGILARRNFMSFVPWCPAYPDDLFHDASSSSDDSLPSDYEGDPEDEGLPSDYDDEDVYQAYLDSLLP